MVACVRVLLRVTDALPSVIPDKALFSAAPVTALAGDGTEGAADKAYTVKV
jgi:hypothetical protein